MMNRIYIYIFIITFSSCKKYEEGPVFSLKTVRARLTGVWEIEKYIVNGIDSTDLIKENPCYGQITLNKYNPRESQINVSIATSVSCPFGNIGIWILSDDKKTISIEFVNHYPYHSIQAPYGGGKKTDWKILKLYNKKMKLKTEYDGKTYVVTYVKTKEIKGL